MRHRWLAAALVAAWAGAPCTSHAQRSADTLRVAWRDAITRIDPYDDPSLGSFVIAHQVFDTLVYRDPKTFRIVPLLATAWNWQDDRTLVFTLRQGVLWQDGNPVTAADVAGTINWVASNPNLANSPIYDWIAGADILDPAHVRVRLSRTMPAALEYFAMALWILPEGLRERIGADTFARAPIGSGPYRVVPLDGSGDVTLERFAGYFAGSPKGEPSIARIRFRSIPDPTAQLAALLSGDADWTWRFDPAGFTAIERHPALVGVEGGSLRLAYLSLDAAGRSGPANPLTKLRVRQAIEAALDRSALAGDFGPPGAAAPAAPCLPAQFGCDVKEAVTMPYDPERARALLREAGFPDGFSLQITTAAPAPWSAAVQSYLRAVGINAEIIQLPQGEVTLRAIQGENRAELGDWGSYAVNDVSAILPHFFGFTSEDYTRDPELRDLIADADATRDPARRLSDYARSIRIITANADWLPLWSVPVPYGFTKDLDFTPDPDGVPRFFTARWKGREAAGVEQ
ncbi:MAG TPA: ABC transporter substrate-binding protein [Acetobacteraceae bacterium]|nr:ABC transporter substrate-binding protein [Acetobacteraceae bacterium]